MIAATGITGTIGRHLSKNIVPIQVNMAENFQVPIFDDSHVVIHMAGVVGEQKVRQDIEYSYKINVQNTIELAKQFIEQGIKRFVYVSSSHVYKSTSSPISETFETEPINRYAEQKLEAEMKLGDLFSTSDSELVVLRVFSILDQEMPSASLGGALERIAKGTFSGSMNSGDDVRDFLSQKQIAEVVEEIAKTDDLPPLLNICSAQGESIFKAAHRMLPFLSEAELKEIVNPGLSNTPSIVGDNQLLRELLPNFNFSWKPTPFDRSII